VQSFGERADISPAIMRTLGWFTTQFARTKLRQPATLIVVVVVVDFPRF
jgi:hypothetical protein